MSEGEDAGEGEGEGESEGESEGKSTGESVQAEATTCSASETRKRASMRSTCCSMLSMASPPHSSQLLLSGWQTRDCSAAFARLTCSIVAARRPAFCAIVAEKSDWSASRVVGSASP